MLKERNRKLQEEWRKDRQHRQRPLNTRSSSKEKKEQDFRLFEEANDRKKHDQNILWQRKEDESERAFQETSFYKQAREVFGGIPFFCDIPTKGEIGFLYDRRIWQMELFDKFFYKRKAGGTISCKKIYGYFRSQKAAWLREEMIYNRNLEKDLIMEAIVEYMKHLAQLGFLSKSFLMDTPQDQQVKEYEFTRNTLHISPVGKGYGEKLKNAIQQNSKSYYSFIESFNDLIPKQNFS